VSGNWGEPTGGIASGGNTGHQPVYSGHALRPITVIRALQWVAMAITAWAMSLPWGLELEVGKGPPSQWERHVVGAALLLLAAAITMSLTGRKDQKPGGLALGLAGAFTLGALGLALALRSGAIDRGQSHVLLGGGWMWMMAGGCISLGSVAGAFMLRFRPVNTAPETASKAPARRGSGGAKKKKKRKKR